MRIAVRRWGVGLLGVAAVAAVAVGSSRADKEGGAEAERIEQVVRELLMREPELVYDALQELQRKQQAAEAERLRGAIVERRDELLNDPDAPVAGAPEGSATLVEFFDYRCGYCRRMVPVMQALLEEDEDLRVVFKELPVLGPDSVLAARAALASREQDGDLYVPFHFALMGADDLSEPSVMRIAGEVGLDVDRLRADMESPEVARAIQKNYDLARELGIQGTPAFVVGDELVPGAVDRVHLERLIEAARDGAAG